MANLNSLCINYSLLGKAYDYYKFYKFHEANPKWYASEYAITKTFPHLQRVKKLSDNRLLVGSAEQSMIDLYKSGKLSKDDMYFMSCTPCWRDDEDDEIHCEYFMKLELTAFNEKKTHAEQDFEVFFNLAKNFFERDLNIYDVTISPIVNNSCDIFGYSNVLQKPIELGSYGIRRLENTYLVYGTGLALPRTQLCIEA